MMGANSSASVAALYSRADAKTTAAAAAALGKKGDVLGHPEKIKETAKNFEALFITQMLEQMFPEEQPGLFGDQYGEDVYRDWMIEQYGSLIAESGGIGVADHVQRELLKLQEANHGGEAAATETKL